LRQSWFERTQLRFELRGALNVPIGIAYRPHFRIELFAADVAVDYLEITAEDYLGARGRIRADLDALKASFPIVVHAVGLSIGSACGLDRRYLERLAALIEYVRAPWWSDHLAFSRADDLTIGHFVPLRRDEAAIEIVARNADIVRRTISVPFALENPALPFIVPGGTLGASEFLTRTARAARCKLLVDVENVQADERNWRADAELTLAQIPAELIAEVHIAGGRQLPEFYLDSHDAPVCERTWELAAQVMRRGAFPLTLERDGKLTNLAAMRGALERARMLERVPT